MVKKSVEVIETVEEDEPIYFAPKRVGLVSDIASVLSWIVLVGFLADVVVQILSLRSQILTNGYLLSDLLKELSFFSVIFANVVEPLMIGLGLFALLQAAAVGLDMLLEMIYKAHEPNSQKIT